MGWRRRDRGVVAGTVPERGHDRSTVAGDEWVVVFESASPSSVRRVFELLADAGLVSRTKTVEGFGVSSGLVRTGQVLVAAAGEERARQLVATVERDLQEREGWQQVPPSSLSDIGSDDHRTGMITLLLILGAMAVLGWYILTHT